MTSKSNAAKPIQTIVIVSISFPFKEKGLYSPTMYNHAPLTPYQKRAIIAKSMQPISICSDRIYDNLRGDVDAVLAKRPSHPLPTRYRWLMWDRDFISTKRGLTLLTMRYMKPSDQRLQLS